MEYDKSSYCKPEPSETTTRILEEFRSQRALQKSGSDIALSSMSRSNEFGSRGDFRYFPSSTDSVTKHVRSKSHMMLPRKTEYYYQGNFTSTNRLNPLEEDYEGESSDEDHQPIVYPENRYLGHTMKI
jgi:hypothetical protein